MSLACLLLAAALLPRPVRADTFTADATVSRADGTKTSARLTVILQSFSTAAEREALLASVRKGGTAARDLLKTRVDIGTIEVGGQKTPVKYAYTMPAGSTQLITAVTAEAVNFWASDQPGAKPKAGYDLGLVLIQLDGTKAGSGELAPAARVKIDDRGAIVTEDYGADVVRLSNVVRR